MTWAPRWLLGYLAAGAALVLQTGVRWPMACAAPAEAQDPSAVRQAESDAGASDDFPDSLVAPLLAAMERQRVAAAPDSGQIADALTRADEALKLADEPLAQKQKDLAGEPTQAMTAQRKQRLDRLQQVLERRCRIALARCDVHLQAAVALPADDPNRAAWLEQARQMAQDLRVEYRTLRLAAMGYVVAARSHRLAGQYQAAIALLDPLLAAATPLDDVRRAAVLEDLEIQLLINPSAVVDKAAVLLEQPEFQNAAAWRGRVRWLVARAHAARLKSAAKLSPSGSADPKAVERAASLATEPDVIAAVAAYDRFELLAELDALTGGKTMTPPQCIEWAQLLAATGRTADAQAAFTRVRRENPQVLTVRQWMDHAAVLARRQSFAELADVCDQILALLPATDPQMLPVLQWRAAALDALMRQRNESAKPRDPLTARTLSALADVFTSQAAPEVRRDALKQWTRWRVAAAAPVDALAVLESQPQLVDADAYLLFIRAAGRWQRYAAASSAPTREQAQAVLDDVLQARGATQPAPSEEIAAAAALLQAQVLSRPPLIDRSTALRVLDENAALLAKTAQTADPAASLRIELLLELGMPDAAMEALEKASQNSSGGSLAVLLRLLDALTQRFDGLPAQRQAVMDLCAQVLRRTAHEPRDYLTAGRHVVRTYMRIQAYPDAQRLAESLLQLPVAADQPDARLELRLIQSQALRQRGQLPGSLQQAKLAIEEHPTSADAWLAGAQSQLALRQPAEAAAAARQARQLAPAGSESWWSATFLLSQSLHSAGQTEAGRQILRVAVALHPQPDQPHLRRELAHLQALLRSAATQP